MVIESHRRTIISVGDFKDSMRRL